jgi:hypothetical protein
MVYMVVRPGNIYTIQAALIPAANGNTINFGINGFSHNQVERGGIDKLNVMYREISGDVNAQETRPPGAAILVGT